jgi:hypothetical protein
MKGSARLAATVRLMGSKVRHHVLMLAHIFHWCLPCLTSVLFALLHVHVAACSAKRCFQQTR